jgi:hypothetical protein
MAMTLKRSVILAAVFLTLSGSAAAFDIFDPVNTFQHRLLNQWRESIARILTQQLIRIQQMSKRLSEVTALDKYVAEGEPPRWRTRRIDAALEASDAFMAAINGGDAEGRGYAAVARARERVGAAFARFGEDDADAENALRAALATIDLADGIIVAGADQTGRIRGSRRSELNTINALESDTVDPNLEQSTTAVLEKVAAASLIRARQQETRMELLTALTEQLLLESKRERDTDVAAMNMRVGQLAAGAVAPNLLAGSAAAFRSWRQP